MAGEIFAGIEIGTSSTRLAIGEVINGSYVDIIAREFFSHGLSSDLIENRDFSEYKIDGLVDWFHHACSLMITHKVKRCHVGAIEAIFIANSAKGMFARIFDETGLKVEGLTSIDEIEMSLAGNASLIDKKTDETIFVESGSGSTKFSIVDNNLNIKKMVSFAFGTSTWVDKFNTEIVISDKHLKTWEDELKSMFATELKQLEFNNNGKTPLVIAGTPSFVMRFYKRYDGQTLDTLEGRWTTYEENEHAYNELVDMGAIARSESPFIYKNTSPYMTPAAMIIKVILEIFNASGYTVGSGGLARGLLISASRGAGHGI